MRLKLVQNALYEIALLPGVLAPVVRLRPLVLTGLLTALVVFGTVGYRLIEGWSWLDCLFMTAMTLTAMTLTTLGYGSPGPLHTDGKVFSVILMLFGIGLMLYLLTLLAETILRTVTDPLAAQRRKERKIMNLKNHTIVCGYGQVGEAVATALKGANKDVVVIDQRTEHLEWAQLHGLHTVVGDATDEDILHRAGVETASALVGVINSDPGNLYVVLSARGMNPHLRVIARASDESVARKVRRAGADDVVNPYQVSGNRIAALMLAPHLANLLSGSVTSEHFTVREILQAGDTVLVAGAAAEVEGVEVEAVEARRLA